MVQHFVLPTVPCPKCSGGQGRSSQVVLDTWLWTRGVHPLLCTSLHPGKSGKTHCLGVRERLWLGHNNNIGHALSFLDETMTCFEISG